MTVVLVSISHVLCNLSVQACQLGSEWLNLPFEVFAFAIDGDCVPVVPLPVVPEPLIPGLLLVDPGGLDPIPLEPQCLTADGTSLRFHGASYGGSYSRHTLMAQAIQIDQYLADGLDVFVYFNNEAHGYAVQNPADLRRSIRGDRGCGAAACRRMVHELQEFLR
jgi:hypothetical protein